MKARVQVLVSQWTTSAPTGIDKACFTRECYHLEFNNGTFVPGCGYV
jgi:hypothetical protein